MEFYCQSLRSARSRTHRIETDEAEARKTAKLREQVTAAREDLRQREAAETVPFKVDRHTAPAIHPDHLRENPPSKPFDNRVSKLGQEQKGVDAVPHNHPHKVGTIHPDQVKHITSRVRVFASVPEMCDACKTMVEELHP